MKPDPSKKRVTCLKFKLYSNIASLQIKKKFIIEIPITFRPVFFSLDFFIQMIKTPIGTKRGFKLQIGYRKFIY